MDQNFPKSEEVCKIVATCRKADVSYLKYGVLEVWFRPARAEGAPSEPGQEQKVSATTPAEEIQGKPTQVQEQVEQESIEEQGILAREMQIAELRISDPLKAEQMMEEGDLIPSGESTDGREPGETFDI